MMKICRFRDENESAVSGMLEYVMITGVLMVMFIMVIFAVDLIFISGPAEDLRYHSFVDIGNGMSTRLVDLYVISPSNGTVSTSFDLPDDLAGEDYEVRFEGLGADQNVIITDGTVISTVSIAGIGATRGVTGNTTGSGLNRITYNSSGVD